MNKPMFDELDQSKYYGGYYTQDSQSNIGQSISSFKNRAKAVSDGQSSSK